MEVSEKHTAWACGIQGDETDPVCQRIADTLERGEFELDYDFLGRIHSELFGGDGSFKEDYVAEPEPILNGDSVEFAEPRFVKLTLKYLFEREANAGEYAGKLERADLARFARFITLIWQAHPFAFGNTRTIAVFALLYLEHMGIEAHKEPFKSNFRYFRAALARANYRNAPADIVPDFEPIRNFFDNLVNDAGHPLKYSELRCPALFDKPHLRRNIDLDEAIASGEKGRAGFSSFISKAIAEDGEGAPEIRDASSRLG